ncbi:hypothetical protein Vadar_010367 [Vaccinium darrowii]|uniref:Uncharacterized protein n=1 Tax=Vaccinium darrowii TaxID=229202 RepID=A0ACB7XGL2_9ERIC|nr:hypothetical protein Vadar_010367 [Vaccinium darrowii]
MRKPEESLRYLEELWRRRRQKPGEEMRESQCLDTLLNRSRDLQGARTRISDRTLSSAAVIAVADEIDMIATASSSMVYGGSANQRRWAPLPSSEELKITALLIKDGARG